MCLCLIQPPITSSLSAESTAETASEVDSTADNYSTLTGVDEATLGICQMFCQHEVDTCTFSVCVCVFSCG